MSGPCPPAVVARISRQEPVLDQPIRWTPGKWTGVPLGVLGQYVEHAVGVSEPSSTPGDLLIRRRHVVCLAEPAAQFLASMIWGMGRNAYGPARVAAIAETAGGQLEDSLEGIGQAARRGAADAWDAFVATHRVVGLGPAFASKFAYFASVASDPTVSGPLIVDLNTSWAMWDLVGLKRSVERRDGYLKYVALAQRWAAEVGCRPDDVELAVFEIGKKVLAARRAAKKSRRRTPG